MVNSTSNDTNHKSKRIENEPDNKCTNGNFNLSTKKDEPVTTGTDSFNTMATNGSYSPSTKKDEPVTTGTDSFNTMATNGSCSPSTKTDEPVTTGTDSFNTMATNGSCSPSTKTDEPVTTVTYSNNTMAAKGGCSTSPMTDEPVTKVTKEKFLLKIKHNLKFRHKIIRTACMCWSSMVYGWTTGQIGPSLLDFQILTGSTLEEASGFLTCGSIGQLCGSLLSGYLHSKVDGNIFLLFCLTGVSMATVILPWCHLYVLMMVAMFVRHLLFGVYTTVINAELMVTWRAECKIYMQMLHLCFAIGGILSPIATAPFLLSSSTVANNTTQGNIEYFGNISNITLDINGNIASDMPNLESKLYIAYIMTSLLLISAAIPFLILYIGTKFKHFKDDSQNKTNQERRIKRGTKLCLLIIVASLVSSSVAIEKGLFQFLTAFCVKQFHWTKSKSSYANSVFWASYAISRVLAIFIISKLSPAKMILIYATLLVLSCTGLTVTSAFYLYTGFWIFLGLNGFSISVIIPTIFPWTEKHFFTVTGSVTSILIVSGSVGGMVNPLAIGSLMDDVTPMYFCYLLLGESVILLSLFLFGSVVSKNINPEETTNKEVTEDFLET